MACYQTVFVKDVTVRGRHCSRFPLVVNIEGGASLDLLRYLISLFGKGDSERSLELYATHLRDFYEQLQVDDCGENEITLDYLNEYKSLIEKRASAPYASQLLRTVLSFLLYLEQRGVVCGLIGESANFKIQIRKNHKGGIVHSLSSRSESPKSNYCPSDKAIEAIKLMGPKDNRANERFELMTDWAHVKGLRAIEICGLKTNQIPDSTSIQRALEDNRLLELTLVITKGRKPRKILVHPILLARTLKFIEADRPEIVRRARKRARRKGITFAPTDEIFLSEVTGRAITTRSLSNLVRRAFVRSVQNGTNTKEERVWLHGLRKRMVNREISKRPEEGEYRRETAVRQQTGHGSLNSMGRYVVEPL